MSNFMKFFTKTKPETETWGEFVSRMVRHRPALAREQPGSLLYLADLADKGDDAMRLNELLNQHGLYRSLDDDDYKLLCKHPYPLKPDDWKRWQYEWRVPKGRAVSAIKGRMDYGYFRQWKAGLNPLTVTIFEALMPILYLHGYDFPKVENHELLPVDTPPGMKRMLLPDEMAFTETMFKHSDGRWFIGYNAAHRSLTDAWYGELYFHPYPLSMHDLRSVFCKSQPWGLVQSKFWDACGISRAMGYRLTSGKSNISKNVYDRVMPVLYLHGYDFDPRDRVKNFKPGVPDAYRR